MVLDLIGSEVQSHSLARGKVNEQKARIVFIIKGKNGEYLVSVEGDCSNEDMTIKTLSLHKRGSIPADEHYVYQDGVLVTSLLDEKEELE